MNDLTQCKIKLPKQNILIKTKAFIITGGQDNIQSVAGQLMWFFTDLDLSFLPSAS
jgi:hypothetical protein